MGISQIWFLSTGGTWFGCLTRYHFSHSCPAQGHDFPYTTSGWRNMALKSSLVGMSASADCQLQKHIRSLGKAFQIHQEHTCP